MAALRESLEISCLIFVEIVFPLRFGVDVDGSFIYFVVVLGSRVLCPLCTLEEGAVP